MPAVPPYGGYSDLRMAVLDVTKIDLVKPTLHVRFWSKRAYDQAGDYLTATVTWHEKI